MGLDNNDSTIRDLKAYLCDFFCQKIKELSEIEDEEKKNEYIACLIKAAENADNLSNSFEQFESLEIPVKTINDVSEKEEVVEEKKDTSIENKKEVLPIDKIIDNSNDLDSSDNKQIFPIPVKKEKDPDVKNKSILPPSIKMEAPILPKMPNIFEGIFNSNQNSGNDMEENSKDSTTMENVPVSESVQETVSEPDVSEHNLENNNSTNIGVVSIPRVDNNTTSDSSVSPLVAAYTNGTVQRNDTILNSDVKTKMLKLSSDKVKAILVNKNQLERLTSSLAKQQQLLDFGQVSVTPSQNDIEAMMSRAKQLYNEGKQKEAQQLYDEISQINKTNVLIKKAA